MNAPSIEHVVVLLFENRSFDHILGYLPQMGQLTGGESCPIDPANPRLGRVPVNRQAEYAFGPDPLHDLLSVNLQLFGNGSLTAEPAPLNGFVKSFTAAAGNDVAVGKHIMDCFDPARLPALSALAQEYCLCTRWFSSVPGPTWPNRFFVHAATSDGVATNDVLHLWDMRTIYDNLEVRSLTWNIFYHDFPHSIALRGLWNRRNNFRKYTDFVNGAQRGVLPNYSFVEPRYFDLLDWHANDFHPPHDVRYADTLVADAYGTLRASSLWEKSLLIVLFDEHGGYYDHVSPPRGVPNPDGKASSEPPFDFARLGLRVPAILVSPWIDKATVDSTIYEHASIPATLAKLFGLNTFLTARDRAAHTFDSVLSRGSPREDAPTELPTSQLPDEQAQTRDLEAALGAPLSEFHETLVHLADLLTRGEEELEAAPRTLVVDEHTASAHVQTRIAEFLEPGSG